MRLIGLVSLVFVVASGGVGAWWFLSGQSSHAEGIESEPPSVVAALSPSYVDLDPLIVPVIGEGQVLRVLTLKVTIEVEGSERLALVETSAPRVRDAMLSELHALLSLRHVQQRPSDVDLYRRHLLAVSEQRLGRGVVKDVLIRELGSQATADG